MKLLFVVVSASILMSSCNTITPKSSNNQKIPTAYLGLEPTLIGTITNWSGQIGEKIQWYEYKDLQPPKLLAEGNISATGQFAIVLPSPDQMQEFLRPFVATNLPPITRNGCDQGNLQFDRIPNWTTGGLEVKINGQVKQVSLVSMSEGGKISGMLPNFFDREFYLTGQAVCTGRGYPETIIGRMHGLPGWNWTSYRQTFTEKSSLEETFTGPPDKPLFWVLR